MKTNERVTTQPNHVGARAAWSAGIGALAMFVLSAPLILAFGEGDPGSPLTWPVPFLGMALTLLWRWVTRVELALIPAVLIAALPIAILRYRLYDIETISRTVSYAIVTATLAGLFVLVALAPTTLFGAAQAPEWLIAAGTLAVAALFRPVRRRVHDAVDRRFNRAQYDAARTIGAFTTRLRDQIDLETPRSELTGVIGTTMLPVHVSLWVPSREA